MHTMKKSPIQIIKDRASAKARLQLLAEQFHALPKKEQKKNAREILSLIPRNIHFPYEIDSHEQGRG